MASSAARRLVVAHCLAVMHLALGASVAAFAEDAKLRSQLDRPVAVTWQQVPLDAALGRLVETQSIAVWLDRRIDPSTPIAMTAADRPLSEVLLAIAEQAGAKATPFGSLVYVGPEQTADELATLAVLARKPLAKAPSEIRNRWLKPRSWSIANLSQPRDLLEDLAKKVGARIENGNAVPHDLWAERRMPTAPAVDYAVLLLAGFDMSPVISADGSSLAVAAIKRPVGIVKEYRVPASRQAAFDAAVAKLTSAASVEKGSRRRIAARVEDHERLRTVLTGRPANAATVPSARRETSTSPPALADRRFTLTIANKPVAPVLSQLAAQLDLQVEWEASIPMDDPARTALISCTVEQANLDELLAALLEPAGLAFERQESRIAIRRQ